MFRRSLLPLAVACALEPGAAFAAASTPCDGPDPLPRVDALRARLAGSDDTAAWVEIATAAEALATTGEDLPDPDRACAAYVAGSAWFYLSKDAAEQRLRAARAVRAFTLATALAPDAMAGRQPQSRLLTAWRRVGRVPGWLAGAGRPVAITVPAPRPTEVGTLRLEPVDAAAWKAVCAEETCAEAAAIVLPRRAGRTLAFSARPGRYRLIGEGPCGHAEAEIALTAGALTPPDPPICRAAIAAHEADGETPIEGLQVIGGNKTIDAAHVPVDRAPVKVWAPGYKTTEVDLPETGGPVDVVLQRCPVRLTVETRPPGGKVEGDGPAPWGPRAVRVTHAGHAPLETTVDVPRPESCAGATHHASLTLSRPVDVAAFGPAGDAVTLERLVVQGEPVTETAFFRPPGRYAFQAMHPVYGLALGRFEVPACPAGDCPPAQLEVRFVDREGPPPPPPAEPSRGPLITMGIGGVVLTAGLIAGGAALGTQGEIEGYTTKVDEGRGIDELIDQRDKQARAADTLLLAGGVVVTTGLVWWLIDRAIQ